MHGRISHSEQARGFRTDLVNITMDSHLFSNTIRRCWFTVAFVGPAPQH
jgi:hypothetical protein